jgi:hypothetical protein
MPILKPFKEGNKSYRFNQIGETKNTKNYIVNDNNIWPYSDLKY